MPLESSSSYTKEVLAHQYSLSLDISFVKKSLDESKDKHLSELNNETLIHSEEGSHYTSHVYIDTVEEMKLTRSMSRRGNCSDNAPEDSFFGHIKDEINENIKECKNDEEVFKELDKWFDYSSTDRPIFTLKAKTPVEYYQYLIQGGEIIKP